MLKFVGALLAAFFISAGFAQQYKFINYSVADGLAQSQVTDICQDKYGYLWVGTGAGLSRFDGISFKNYSIDDGLLDNYITSLYYDNNDVLWMSTPLGVSKFENQEIVSYPFDVQYRVNDIAEFKGELYLASTTGLLKMEGQVFSVLGAEEELEYYHRAVVNYKDSILICGSRQGLFIWDGVKYDSISIEGINSFNVRDLYIDGEVLLISDRNNKGLIVYNLETEFVEIIDLEDRKPQFITSYNGGIYGSLVRGGGFFRSDRETVYFENNTGFEPIIAKCLLKDSEGNLWIGADTYGLMKFTGTSVVSFTFGDEFESVVMDIDEDSDGQLIFGTYGTDVGIITYDSTRNFGNPVGVDFRMLDIGAKSNKVWTVFVDSCDRRWIGTSIGVVVLDSQGKSLANGLSDIGFKAKVRSIYAWKGDMLFGGDEGLYILNENGVSVVDSLNIFDIVNRGDYLYYATADGLYRSRNKAYDKLEKINLPAQKVNTLEKDYKGNLWLGTEIGLFVLNRKLDYYRIKLDKEDNYRSKNVYALLNSKHDSSMWVGCMKGVYQIVELNEHPNIPYTIYNYGLAEGLIDEEVNQNALHEDINGLIWVGTASGLARIDPSQRQDIFNYELPNLHINGIRLFMENFDYGNYNCVLDPSTGVPNSIEFPYNKNHITFDFIGINQKNPTSVQYEYRLLGADEHWSPVSSSTYATYSFIQPGEYKFQVRAMNKSREWSGIEEVSIVISPPFWKTWWFIAVGFILTSIIIVLLFQARISAIKQKQATEKLDMKNRLLFLEQRSLNASMNRHFIFNSLNSIQYFINGSDKLAANRFLTNFAKLIRKNLDSSASNNFIVTLQEEIERIELYLSLEKMRFSEKFDYVVDVSSSLDTESIEIPSMILQPFVENSIIHGVLALDRKGEIKVRIFQEFGEVIFEVTDNGMGIDNSLKNKENAIAGDHESKGVEITNRRIELLRKLTGENLLIIGPFQMNDEDGNCLGTKVIMKLGGTEKFED